MKTLSILIVALILTGCTTQKRCFRKFPPALETQIITETEVVTRDTTIVITIPAEQVVKIDTVIIDAAGLVHSKLSYLETSLAWSTAQIRNSRLHHELHQIDTLIEVRLEDAIREIDRLHKELSKQVTTVEVERRLSWWQRVTMVFGYLFIGAIILFAGLLVLRIFKYI